ncbi:MAG: glycosyltransferase family 2 protein [bacterium]
MKITALIAALNEEKCIAQTIKNIPRDSVDEILVVDGHSKDRTAQIAESLGCRVLVQPGKGFGDGYRHGFKNASGDIVVTLDADYSQNPKDIPRLVAKLAEGYDIAMGSRYMPGAGTEDDTFIRSIGNKIFTFLTNLFYGTKVSDSLYFFVAAKKEVFNSLDLKADDFSLCIEFLAKAKKAGYKFGEVPCFEKARYADVSRVNAFKDGLKIFWKMFKWI